AAAGDGAAARHTLPRARFAYGKQLPWLRDGANQEFFSSAMRAPRQCSWTIARSLVVRGVGPFSHREKVARSAG
ncbi:hypothetical protein, partial [Xanthomonas oryzae]